MKSTKVLFVVTSYDKIGDTDISTGLWLEELSTPYYLFKEAGADITIASPKGGLVPLDPKSQSILIVTRSGKRFMMDPEAREFLGNSVLLKEVKAIDYDLVFLVGGHGAMWDFTGNKILKQLLEDFNNSDKLIGSVGQGMAALLSLQNRKGGLLIKNKNLTTFSNSEEESSGLMDTVPFLLEAQVVLLGALYSKAENYVSYVVADGNIITGQNPASSEAVARRMATWVQDKKYSMQ